MNGSAFTCTGLGTRMKAEPPDYTSKVAMPIEQFRQQQG
jgi:hypothetical protein